MGSVRSMTGFGIVRFEYAGALYELEIRTVNNRYLKLSFKLPSSISQAQEEIRRVISSSLSRGSVDVFVRSGESNGGLYSINKLQIERYKQQISQSLPDAKLDDTSLLMLPGVATKNDLTSDDTFVAVLESPLKDALSKLDESREREGATLVAEIRSRLATCVDIVARISERAGEIPRVYMEKIKARVSELLSNDRNGIVDESSIAREVAFLADRADITEEIVRFNHHASRLESLMKNGGAIGKECDFVVQEMNREANTIGSKCSDLTIADAVITLKTEIEKIREQVQNIE